jgi:3-hydroxyacyl-CoA dehydrogenase
VKAEHSSPEVIATAFRFAKRLRKTPVLSGVCDGFIGNRILSAYRRAAEYLLADGALPQDIDQAMRDFGLAMGPFEAQDMAGLQIGFANRRRQDATRPETERYVDIGDQLVGMGRTGRQAGKGWYRYEDGARKPIVDPEVTDLITGYSDRHGIARQVFQAEGIQRMLLAAMANEGAQLVAEGIAQSAADVDVVKCAGYGFPRWRGGPMHAAHAIGSDTMIAAFAHLQKASPNSWVRAAQFPMKP